MVERAQHVSCRNPKRYGETQPFQSNTTMIKTNVSTLGGNRIAKNVEHQGKGGPITSDSDAKQISENEISGVGVSVDPNSRVKLHHSSLKKGPQSTPSTLGVGSSSSPGGRKRIVQPMTVKINNPKFRPSELERPNFWVNPTATEIVTVTQARAARKNEKHKEWLKVKSRKPRYRVDTGDKLDLAKKEKAQSWQKAHSRPIMQTRTLDLPPSDSDSETDQSSDGRESQVAIGLLGSGNSKGDGPRPNKGHGKGNARLGPAEKAALRANAQLQSVLKVVERLNGQRIADRAIDLASAQPCRDFFGKGCNRKRCKFSHDPLPEPHVSGESKSADTKATPVSTEPTSEPVPVRGRKLDEAISEGMYAAGLDHDPQLQLDIEDFTELYGTVFETEHELDVFNAHNWKPILYCILYILCYFIFLMVEVAVIFDRLVGLNYIAWYVRLATWLSIKSIYAAYFYLLISVVRLILALIRLPMLKRRYKFFEEIIPEGTRATDNVNAKIIYPEKYVRIECTHLLYGHEAESVLMLSKKTRFCCTVVEVHALSNVLKLLHYNPRATIDHALNKLSNFGSSPDNVLRHLLDDTTALIFFLNDVIDRSVIRHQPAPDVPRVVYAPAISPMLAEGNNGLALGFRTGAVLAFDPVPPKLRATDCILDNEIFGNVSYCVGPSFGISPIAVAMGFAHRQLSAMPEVDLEMADEIELVFDTLIEFIGVADVVPITKDLGVEWINSCNQTQAWKTNKLQEWAHIPEDVITEFVSIRKIGAFVKRETLAEIKNPRLIMPMPDLILILVGYYISQLESHIAHHIKAFTKGLNQQQKIDRFTYIRSLCYLIICNDFSSFEQSVTEILRTIETWFFIKMLGGVEAEHAGDVFSYFQMGKIRRCNGVQAAGRGIRFSGESQTGLGAALINYTICVLAGARCNAPKWNQLTVAEKKARILTNMQMDTLCVDGDDMQGCHPSTLWPAELEFVSTKLGFKSKVTCHDNLADAAFCQLYVSTENQVMLDPVRVMMKFNVGSMQYVNATTSTRRGLLKAKAMSYLALAPASPIIAALSRYVKRKYKHIDATAGIKRLMSDSYNLRYLLPGGNIAYTEQPILPGTRIDYARKFGVSVNAQLIIERCLDDDIFPSEWFQILLPQALQANAINVWPACYEPKVEEWHFIDFYKGDQDIIAEPETIRHQQIIADAISEETLARFHSRKMRQMVNLD